MYDSKQYSTAEIAKPTGVSKIREGQKVLLGQESAATEMARVKQGIQPLVGQR